MTQIYAHYLIPQYPHPIINIFFFEFTTFPYLCTMKKQNDTAKMMTPTEAFEHFLRYKNEMSRNEVTHLYAQMRAAILETTGKERAVHQMVSDAQRDHKETRKNSEGVVMKLGIDRIKMILEAVPGGMYRFQNDPFVWVK